MKRLHIIIGGVFLAALAVIGGIALTTTDINKVLHASGSPEASPGQGVACSKYDQAGGFFSLPKEDVDREIDPFIQNGTFVGVAVAVIDEGGYEVWGYGETRLNSSVLPDENTVFEIGSVSKTFNGVLLADSILRGNMTLTAPVSLYLQEDRKVPSFEGRNITPLDLATHTSGLPAVPDAFFEGADENISAGNAVAEVYENIISHYQSYPPEETYQWLGEVNLTGPIGSSWSYSNVGSAILGDAISRANNMAYRDLLKERITGPLGMNSTDTVMTPELTDRAATGYRNYGGPLAEARKIEFSGFWDPSGGMYSTPRDMVRYTLAAMGACPSSISEAFNVSEMPFAVREESPQLMFQGLQWDILPLPDGTEIVMKSGETNAYQTQLAFSRQHHKGIIIFTNTANVGEGPHVVTTAVSLLMKMIPERSPANPAG
jgi:D-alanyl-D-alanine-carboxypeptidase/D-alanyl-D-alanine-endopeptidase